MFTEVTNNFSEFAKLLRLDSQRMQMKMISLLHAVYAQF